MTAMSDIPHDNHGQSPASWTAVVIMLVGTVIGCIAVIQLNWVLLGVGFAVIAGGVLVGWVMAMMGFGGVKASETKADVNVT